MSITQIPVAQVSATAPNPLGRLALILASTGLLIRCVWMSLQLSVYNNVTVAAGEEDPPAVVLITLAVYGVELALSLLATTLGIVACRRPGRSKVAAAIAVGIGVATLAGYVAMAVSTGLVALS